MEAEYNDFIAMNPYHTFDPNSISYRFPPTTTTHPFPQSALSIEDYGMAPMPYCKQENDEIA